MKFLRKLGLFFAPVIPLSALLLVAPVAAKPGAKQSVKSVQVPPASPWRCLDGGDGCQGQLGFMIKQGEPESWGGLTMGDGTAGVQVLFKDNEIIAGNLVVSKNSILLVRRYNMSDYRRTSNGVPSKFLIRYQFVFRDQGQIRGFILDATNLAVMKDFNLRLSSWNPAIIVVDNDPWFFGG